MCNVTVSERDVDIVRCSIASVLGKPFAANPYIDAFAMDNFFAFTRNKTQIVLNLDQMNKMKERRLIDLVMHSIKEKRTGGFCEDNNNILKPLIFELFPNLKQITIIAFGYPFNLLSLLS